VCVKGPWLGRVCQRSLVRSCVSKVPGKVVCVKGPWLGRVGQRSLVRSCVSKVPG